MKIKNKREKALERSKQRQESIINARVEQRISELFQGTQTSKENRMEEFMKSIGNGKGVSAWDMFCQKERELRKKIREITSDVIDDLFRELWQKKGFWKNNLKNG